MGTGGAHAATGTGGFGQPSSMISGIGMMSSGAGGFSAPRSGGSGGVGAPTPLPGTGTGTGAGTGIATGTGGMGAPGGSTGMPGTAAPMGSKDPIIPPVSGDCPDMDIGGTIDFMGITGLIIDVGPKPPTPTAPMLVYWHGTGLPNNEYTFMAAEVAAGITSAGGVIVSGDGTTGGDLLSGDLVWGMGDIPVMDQLVACAVQNHNVDPRRIYSMGCSAGGLMTAAFAAIRSSYVAAAAPNSGGWTIPGVATFDSDHTPALMTVHGAPGVDVVAIDFSDASATADAAYKAHGGYVIDCNTGGGHCGGDILAGDAWTFLQAHTFGVDPEPWTALPAGFGQGFCTIQ